MTTNRSVRGDVRTVWIGDVWPELAQTGLLFVVSAVETTSDEILRLLDKGHTASDAATAVGLLREHGIDLRPSFLPFTPWTRVEDLVDILEFIDRLDLYGNVDPIQLTIRLLIPEGSLVLDVPEILPYLEQYDAELLSWRWHAADPRVDELQARLATIVEEGVVAGEDGLTLLGRIWEAVLDAAGRVGEPVQLHAGLFEGRPRLTEPWFC